MIAFEAVLSSSLRQLCLVLLSLIPPACYRMSHSGSNLWLHSCELVNKIQHVHGLLRPWEQAFLECNILNKVRGIKITVT